MKLTFYAACASGDDLQHHHLIMRSEGGSEDERNLVTLCRSCHDKPHERRTSGAYNHSQLIRSARERKRRETGKKVGGRKNYAELDGGPEMLALAGKLHRYPVNGRRRSLADVAKALAEAGYRSSAGTPYTATAVRRMLTRGKPAKEAHPSEPQSTPDEDVVARAKRQLAEFRGE
jgi:hypothetical protein